jgi:sugar O-acyltransferase (sialic acid O-acetyltransferase NeuD family)
MKKRLLIIGAGGFGREVLAWARDAAAANSEWSVGGFLDANASALDNYRVGAGIVGNPETYQPQPGDCFVCAVGDPAAKLRLCRALQQRGGEFITLVHPTALVGPDSTLGVGTILCPQAVVTCNVTVGSFVSLNVQALVGHDAVIGDGCTLNGHSEVDGFARLEEGAFLGAHAVVMPGAKVGAYARVGAGSVVLRKVAAQTTVMGVPAKKVWSADESQASERAA